MLSMRALIKSVDGDTVALVTTPWIKIAELMEVIRYDGQRYSRPSQIHYGGWPQIIHASSRGLLYSTGIKPELIWYDFDGSIKSKIQIEIPKQLVTDEDRSIVESKLVELLEKPNTDPDRLPFKMTRTDLKFANSKAFWSFVAVDDKGFIWLQTASPAFPFQLNGISPIHYRVLSPEGEYLGITQRPRATSGQIVRGHFLAIVPDLETGEMVPTVYRIRPAIEGLDYP